jgi:hypothetical protein
MGSPNLSPAPPQRSVARATMLSLLVGLLASTRRSAAWKGKGRGKHASRAGMKRDQCIIDWISGNCTARLEAPQTVGETEFSAELEWSSSARDMIWRQQGKKGGDSRRASKSEKLLDTCDAVGEAQLLASDSREAETTRATQRKGSKGVSEEIEGRRAVERGRKGGKRCAERAEVEADEAVERWATK